MQHRYRAHPDCPVFDVGRIEFSKTIEGVFVKKEFPVSWLRESRAFLRFEHLGVQVGENIMEYNDFYGFLSSAQLLFKDAQKLAQDYKIDSNSVLQIQMSVVISDKLAVIFAKRDGERTEYQLIPDGWSSDQIPFDRKRIVLAGRLIWSPAMEAVEGYSFNQIISDLKDEYSVIKDEAA